jgi:hypothetical protein
MRTPLHDTATLGDDVEIGTGEFFENQGDVVMRTAKPVTISQQAPLPVWVVLLRMKVERIGVLCHSDVFVTMNDDCRS